VGEASPGVLILAFTVIKYILLACERLPWSIGGAFLPAGAPTFGVAAVLCLSLGVCVLICSYLDAQCIPACVVVFLDTAQFRFSVIHCNNSSLLVASLLGTWEPQRQLCGSAGLHWQLPSVTLLLIQIKMGSSKTKNKTKIYLVCLLGEVTFDGLVSVCYSALRVFDPPVGAQTPALCCAPSHLFFRERTGFPRSNRTFGLWLVC